MVIESLESSRRASLKGLHAALLILIREKPLSTINALPISLLTLAEWEETYWNWYNRQGKKMTFMSIIPFG